MARARQTPATQEQQSEFTCPECGKTFTRAASLGAHRRQTHGVAGASAQTKPRRRSRKTAAATAGAAAAGAATRRRTRRASGVGATDGRVNRNGLLQTIFPNGLPAREEVIKQANAWLDEAERLARTK